MPRSPLLEVALLFTRLGFTAFGGPAAHIAMIEDEVVTRRQWLDRKHFLDIVAAINFIPGPNSTELAIHLGYHRAGFPGLVVAGLCFIVPAVLIILPIGYLYVTYGMLPDVAGPLAGIRAAILAIIAAALVRFARTALTTRFAITTAILCAIAAFLTQRPGLRVPQAELIILALAAIAGALWVRPTNPDAPAAPKLPALPLLASTTLPAAATLSPKLLSLVLFFLKVGATLFGSGYLLVSYLEGGLVNDHRWMTRQQLTDSIAVGQFTPGPLLTTATFVGYTLGHQWSGGSHATAALAALLCTLAIFAPSFVFVSILGPLWPRIRSSARARGALDGMNAAATALIFVVSIQLALTTLHPPQGIAVHQTIMLYAIALASLAALLVWNINSTWLVLVAGGVGYLLLRPA